MTEQKVQNGPRAHRDVLCAETAPGGLGGPGSGLGPLKNVCITPNSRMNFKWLKHLPVISKILKAFVKNGRIL